MIDVCQQLARRNLDGRHIRDEDVLELAGWQPEASRTAQVPFVVGRLEELLASDTNAEAHA